VNVGVGGGGGGGGGGVSVDANGTLHLCHGAKNAANDRRDSPLAHFGVLEHLRHVEHWGARHAALAHTGEPDLGRLLPQVLFELGPQRFPIGHAVGV